eukprot:TRINITY_DN20639_c0_g1_i1.p1 TRINITY_DN20639_c0_g1~~TRINITY_DN20639_c0_g1_i1.p1  ORF type:complete len:1020 (+),score=371.91 TRINITY_DN20639_c0_g1_i1:7-3066(+)
MTSSPPKAKGKDRRTSTMLSDPDEKKRKRTGSNAEEAIDPENINEELRMKQNQDTEEERERTSTMLSDPDEKKRKRTGSNAEEAIDPENINEELRMKQNQDTEEERERNDRMQKIEGRCWRDIGVVAAILNEPNIPTDADFELALVTQRTNEGILRNLKDSGRGDAMTSWWSTESEEVQEFRHLMGLSAKLDEQEWLARHKNTKEVSSAMCSTLLPRYLAAPPGPEQRKRLPTSIAADVIYGDAPYKTEIHASHTADEAIESVVRVIKQAGVAVELPLNAQHVFKVVGKKDYIWGKSPFIDYLHIRKCALSSLQIKLSLMAMDESDTDEDMPVRFTFRDVLSLRSGSKGVSQQSTAHEDLSLEGPEAHLHRELSLWDVSCDVEFVINSLSSICLSPEVVKEQKLKENDDIYVCVVGQLFHGTDQLAPPANTPWKVLREAVPATGLESLSHAVWGSTHGTLRFSMRLQNLPRDARLCLTAVACGDRSHITRMDEDDASKLVDEARGSRRGVQRLKEFLGVAKEDEEEQPYFYLGWVNLQLFDHLGCLRTGPRSLKMWVGNEKANPIGVVSTPKTDPKAERDKQLTLSIALPTFARTVRFPTGRIPSQMRQELAERHKQQMNELDSNLRKNVVNQLRQVRSVIHKDPLYRLTDVDKLLLWQFRKDLTENPTALSKFLQAVDWSSPAAVQDCLNLLHNPDVGQRWRAPPAGEELIALELLDARYANAKVREYAITVLDKLCDALLSECILQLVQVLKYEPYHYSALARFLLKRSVGNPYQIGHAIFWHLKAEMSNPAVQERHGLLIEELLKRVPICVRRGFEKEDALIELLLKIGIDVKKPTIAKKDRNPHIRTELDDKLQKLLRSDAKFTLPLDPRMECSGVRVERCKVMDSKKLPLWLVFKNADPRGENIYVIFKAGDDLRQDLLTLQIIAMMDSMWKAQGLDLHMSPYGCVACDDGVGMIEVVLDSETIANITKKSGGASMAFKEDPMINWLRQQPCNKSPAAKHGSNQVGSTVLRLQL